MKQNKSLSKRENQIAEMLARGAQKWQIAEILFISENTVANTAKNIYEKLEINSAVELATWYLSNRYLSAEMKNYLKEENQKLFSILPQNRSVSYRELRRKRRKDNLNCLA